MVVVVIEKINTGKCTHMSESTNVKDQNSQQGK
jgi:hypothetical protein